MKSQEDLIQSDENFNLSQRTVNREGQELVDRYEQLFAQMHKQNLTIEVKTYFILSVKFLQNWTQYCLSDKFSSSSKPPIIKDEIFEQGNLKPGLKYKTHYQIVDENVYELLEPFVNKQNINQRSVKWQYSRQTQQMTPYFIIECNYLILNPLILRKIDCGYIKSSHFQYKKILLKDQKLIKAMLEQIISSENSNTNSVYFGLWQRTNQTQISHIFSLLRDKLFGLCFQQYHILNFGKQLKNHLLPLSDVATNPQHIFFILQQIQLQSKPIFIENFDGFCRSCNIRESLKVQCLCGKIRYCSEDCRKNDLRTHQPHCSYAEEKEFNKPITMFINHASLQGRTGLQNLGNTCYMNSCLQCLSNTQPLTQYFLKGHFQQQINKKNPLGTKGRLTKTYAKFIRATWCENQTIFGPTQLKNIISKINPNFSGYNQQDVQQFFSFLIDGIHQDLNRIKNKYSIPIDEGFNKPQAELAKQSWKSYLGRNQSIITDLMTGQYRSSLRCPDCQQQSIRFQTFNTLTLPIPIESAVNFFFINKNQNKINIKSRFIYKKNDPNQWLKNACQAVQISCQRCLLYVVTQKENIYKVGRDSMDQIISKIQNEKKNLFLIEKTDEEMKIPKDQLLELTINMTQKDNKKKQLYFKFPMFFNKKTANQQEISRRVLKYIYNQAYNQRKGTQVSSIENYQYIEYEESMLFRQLFKVYLKWGKKIQKMKVVEAKFTHQILLHKNTLIFDILTSQNVDPSNCEILISFQPPDKTTQFSFHRMKKYQENAQSSRTINPKKNISLNNCFDEFIQPQILMGGNEWFCPNCRLLKSAIKQIKIYRAPRILVIQLKRFKQKGNRKQKINALVDFPLELDLSTYVLDQKPIQAYKQEIKDTYAKISQVIVNDIGLDTDSKPKYQLYAVSNHMGELGGGHYTAFAKNFDIWINYNDDAFNPIQKEQVITQKAFLLFYKRKKN